MKRTTLTILALTSAVFTTAAFAQTARAADLCTGVIDPYDIVSEKARFYAAAGKDNELSAAEFSSNKISSTSFRRPFDRWSEMLKFDNDSNKSLDWVEAGAYRLAIQKLAMNAFDANRDGKLTDAERTVACKALASGKIRPPAKKAVYIPPPPRTHSDKHKSSHGKSDKHRYSKSSDAARAAHEAAKRREAQGKHGQKQSPKDIARFDRNKDGKLDANEIAHRDKHKAEDAKRISESRKRYEAFMKQYDTDGDGKLSDREKAAYKEAKKQESLKRIAQARETAKKRAEELRQKREVARFDSNKDGRLDPQESAALEKYRTDQKQRMQEFLAKYDSNGDGQVSSEERAAYLREAKQKKADAIARYDTNGDGIVSSDEKITYLKAQKEAKKQERPEKEKKPAKKPSKKSKSPKSKVKRSKKR